MNWADHSEITAITFGALLPTGFRLFSSDVSERSSTLAPSMKFPWNPLAEHVLSPHHRCWRGNLQRVGMVYSQSRDEIACVSERRISSIMLSCLFGFHVLHVCLLHFSAALPLPPGRAQQQPLHVPLPPSPRPTTRDGLAGNAARPSITRPIPFYYIYAVALVCEGTGKIVFKVCY